MSFAIGRPCKRGRLPGAGELNSIGIEENGAIQSRFHCRAARHLRFRPARKKDRRQPNRGADTRADSCALGAAARDPADSGAGGRGFNHGAQVTGLVAIADYFAFARGCFAPAGSRVARHRVEIHHVPVRKNHGIQLNHQFAAAFHATGPFRFSDFPVDVCARRNDHAAIHHDGRERLEIDGIACARAARRDSVVQNEREMCAAENLNLRAGGGYR